MNTNITAEQATDIEPLLRDVISGFISYPNELQMDCVPMGSELTVRIDGNAVDLPKIIGTGAKNIIALQVLFGKLVEPMELRFDVADRSTERRDTSKAFPPPNPNWPRQDFIDLLKDMLAALTRSRPKVKEEIVPEREFRFGAETFKSEETSTFKIMVDRRTLRFLTAKIETAIEVLFRAIGQQQGRRVIISFTNVQP